MEAAVGIYFLFWEECRLLLSKVFSRAPWSAARWLTYPLIVLGLDISGDLLPLDVVLWIPRAYRIVLKHLHQPFENSNQGR